MGSIEADPAWLSIVQNTELRKRRYLYLLHAYLLLGMMCTLHAFSTTLQSHVCRHLDSLGHLPGLTLLEYP